MGMFDYVKYSAPCYKCGETITAWQSKDGPCLLLTISADEVTNFYSNCDCGAWNEYDVQIPTPRTFVPRRDTEGEK